MHLPPPAVLISGIVGIVCGTYLFIDHALRQEWGKAYLAAGMLGLNLFVLALISRGR